MNDESQIEVDTLAIRGGQPAAGWIVLTNGGDGDTVVMNQLFRAEADAVAYAGSLNPQLEPRVKALRAAKWPKEIGPFTTTDERSGAVRALEQAGFLIVREDYEYQSYRLHARPKETILV